MTARNEQLLPPDPDALWGVVAMALAEDIGKGDITSELLIPQEMQTEMLFVARDELTACGAFIPDMVFTQLNTLIASQPCVEEGERVIAGTVLASAKGPARDMLAGERVALNLMQRMCGVATLTHRCVEEVKHTKAVILDTRKTMPGLRMLDKYAVRAGGGQNHRQRLDDMMLIKDNHIALVGGIRPAMERAREGLRRKGGAAIAVAIECDTLEQLEEALEAAPDRILLDNMSLKDLKRAVKLVAGRVPLEASGGVSPENVRAIAETGVDYISIGRLTHSSPASDIGADIKILS